jgi:hypothetical protein
MGSFPNYLFIKDVSVEQKRFLVILTENFTYLDEKEGEIIVYKNFDFDMASIPGIFQNLISKVGPWDYAACIHDWLYASKALPRKNCDEVFLRALKDSGVVFWKRYAMFWAVRIFAGIAYTYPDYHEVDHYKTLGRINVLPRS